MTHRLLLHMMDATCPSSRSDTMGLSSSSQRKEPHRQRSLQVEGASVRRAPDGFVGWRQCIGSLALAIPGVALWVQYVGLHHALYRADWHAQENVIHTLYGKPLAQPLDGLDVT